VQRVLQKLTTRIEKDKFFSLCPVEEEAAHSLQKNKFLVITFEWNVHFG
jgi:hypothetical protein